MPDPESPINIVSSFFVEAKDWCSSIREAIDKAIKESPAVENSVGLQ